MSQSDIRWHEREIEDLRTWRHRNPLHAEAADREIEHHQFQIKRLKHQ